jgi:hypothetical protein
MVSDVAGLFVVHVVLDEVKTQETWSPLTGVYVKTGLSVPATVPLTFHWYVGFVPPFTGVAVNVTELPAQTLFVDDAIRISTESPGFTVTGKSTIDPVQFPISGVI